MKDKLRQLLALILALSICFSLLSANVWATDEPEDVPTENTEVVTEKDKSEEKQEETPAEAPSEDKQEEAPAETQSENKQEEAPAETQSENKQEETPAEAQSEDKQEEEAPAQNEAETQPIKKKAPARKLTAAAGGTEVTQANVICQQYSYMDAGSYSGGATYDTPPADITNIALADAQAFGAAVNCPTTYWVVVYAKDGDNLKWTSNGKTGEQTSNPVSAFGRVFSAWCVLYDYDVFYLSDPYSNVTFYFSKGLATVAVTGVNLNKTSATLTVGGTQTLTATVLPDNATDKTGTVSWTGNAIGLYADAGCTQALTNGGTYTAGTFYVKGLAAGSSTITVTTTDGSKTATCAVTVNKPAASVTTPVEAVTKEYIGQAQKLANGGVYSGGTMQYALGTDASTVPTSGWTEAVPTATDAGTYYVWYKVAGDANHSDSAPVVLTSEITPRTVTVNNLSVYGKYYDGTTTATLNTRNARFSSKVGNDQLTVSGNAAFTDSNVGSNKVVNITDLTLGGDSAKNYVLSSTTATTTGTINKIYVKVTAQNQTVPLNGSIDNSVNKATLAAGANAPVSGHVLSAITLTASSTENATTSGTITPSNAVIKDGSGNDVTANYGFSYKNGKLTVEKAGINPTVSIEGWTYGEAAKTPSVEGNSGNGEVTYTYAVKGSSDYSATVPTAAGDYTVKATVAATNNYNGGEDTADFTIAKAAITITADDKSTKYGEDIAELTYTVSGAYVEGDDLGVTVATTATKTSDVGEYVISVNWEENSNYTATLTNGKYIITKNGATISATGYTGVYDGKAHGISVEETKHGIFSLLTPNAKVYYATEELTADNFKDKGSETNPTYTNVGEYTVYYFVESGNYDVQPISGSKTVSITKAPLTVTAKDKTIAYGEAPANDSVQYDGFAKGEDESVLTGELSYAYNYKQGDNSGEYTITPSGLTSDNYEITFVDGKLTVKALGDPTLEVTTEGEDKRLDIVLDQESAEKLLTKDELKDYNNGVSATVYVLVDELSASDVPAADKKLAEEFMKDGKIGQYLDLTLWVKVGNRDARQITNAASDITLKIAIPEKLQSKDAERTFYLIRVHDGKAESLASTTGDTLEADSRLFSTYAIGYKDKTVKDGTKKTDTKKTDTTKKTTTKTSGKSPKTGDAAMLGLWVTMAGASATGLGALALTGKRRKNNRRDNRTAGRRRNR